MKKILLILALLSLGVSKAQVVGGYLPVNSTKSATMGGLRVNGNETVTGTFSVGSTATLSGNAYMGQNASNTTTLGGVSMGYNTSSGIMHFGKYSATSNAIWGYHSSTPTTSNYNLNFDANNAYFNSPNALFLVTNGTIRASYGTSSSYNTLPLRIGSNSTPTATLDVTGDAKVSSTFSLGSANLTGGNTGTVAVLSDALFPVQCFMQSTNLVDATTYSIGNIPFSGTGFQNGKVYIPYNCTLVGWTANYFVNGTLGSNETGTLAININGTPTNLNTAITQSAIVSTYSATGLSTSVTAGNYVEALIYTPTWATNPTSTGIGITFWFVRRS